MLCCCGCEIETRSMDKYILKYLFDNASNSDVRRMYDYLKNTVDYRFYSQGRHFTHSWDRYRTQNISMQNKPKWKRVFNKYKSYVQNLISKRRTGKPIVKRQLTLSTDTYNVLSIVNLPFESREALQKCGINCIYLNMNGEIEYDLPAAIAMSQYYRSIQHMTFAELISDENINKLEVLYDDLAKELSLYAFDAVFVRSSELFFEKIFIDIFKSHNKPSITLLHGLPAFYTKATESRAEYLSVWGDKIRDAFIKVGYDPDKVIVAGNYKYATILPVKELRCSKEDVLVLTTETFEDSQHEWEYEKFSTHDRSLLITFIYSVEHVLKQNGITHARLRPHPHVNKDWLKEYIDLDFYTLDNDNMLSSLQKATMCIGPTSSTMIESLMSGVSYMVYEPCDGQHTLAGDVLVPPFNKEYKNFKKAYNEEELSQLIQSRYVPDANMLLHDFLQPFNPLAIKKIIEKSKG